MTQEGADILTSARWRRAWLILGPALLVLALVLPAPEGMTPEAMKLVGVTALMAVWWMGEVVNLAVVAMIPLVTFTLGVRVLDISPGTVPVWAVP